MVSLRGGITARPESDVGQQGRGRGSGRGSCEGHGRALTYMTAEGKNVPVSVHSAACVHGGLVKRLFSTRCPNKGFHIGFGGTFISLGACHRVSDP